MGYTIGLRFGTGETGYAQRSILEGVVPGLTDYAKRFTFYGKMLRSARTLNEVPTESVQWMGDNGHPSRRPVTMPLVVHSLWRALDGALGLVLTNWGDEAQQIELEIPLAKRLPSASDTYVVDLKSGDRLASVVEGGHLRLDLEMAQRAGRGDSALTPARVGRCLAFAKFKAQINPSPGFDPSSARVSDHPKVQTVTLNPDVCQGLTVSVCSAESPDANSRARIRQDPGSSFGARSHWTVI